jgi:hypothetical protein
MWDAVKEPARALDWAWARSRLEVAECYWLVSVSASGAPTPRPVWGVWLDDRLVLSVGSPSHWRNVAANERAAVHLGDPLEVVVVEGSARKGSGPALLERFVTAYNRKYDWNFEPTMDMVVDGTLEVIPSTVLAWVAADAAHSSADMDFPEAAGKWRF